MLVETVNITGNNPIPTAQGRSPTEKRISGNYRKEPDSSRPMVADLQNNLKMISNVDLQFSVHEASGEIMVTVRNEDTGKVIREIPPSETLNLAAKIDEMIGIIFDQKG